VAWLLVATPCVRADEVGAVVFSRDIRPILSKHCFKCHGPDEEARKGGLRLDVREGALKPADSGAAAIVPGKVDESELLARIVSDDAAVVMPPPETKSVLSPREKSLLSKWIAGGADYQPHWSFLPPKQAPLPPVKNAAWPKNEIDRFILARIEAEGMAPSPEADRYTLARRLYLDLLGLIPTVEETDAFVNDTAPDAYERLVDRLLKSPHYGERWARKWLDLARYADTNGYEKDRARTVWPYRDWVIEALNADMPFDRFTIEQLAGDMLPDATVASRVATGFHRNTMLNEEGGIDPLEFRFHAMVDRVGTTATTWMGLTMACSQCHNHKYDPLSQREFYGLFAFLNNADEPEYELPVADSESPAARAERLAKLAALEQDLGNQFPVPSDFTWETLVPRSAKGSSNATLAVQADGSVLVSGENPDTDTYTVEFDAVPEQLSRLRLVALTDASLGQQGPGRTPHGNFVLTELRGQVQIPATEPGSEGKPTPFEFKSAVADFSQDQFPAEHAIDGKPKTGWAIHGPGNFNVSRTLTLSVAPIAGVEKLPAAAKLRCSLTLAQNFGTQHTLGRFKLEAGRPIPTDVPVERRRKEALTRAFEAWLAGETANTSRWTAARPASATSNLPLLTIEEDDCVIATGDQTKRDVYTLDFAGDYAGATAVRIDAIPDERLPRRGPGNVYYEGPFGDFFLSEVKASVGGQPVKIREASDSFASGGNRAASAIDGNPQTGWSINGGQGKPHAAVFVFDKPLPAEAAAGFRIELVFERYYACGLGKFRVSVTRDEKPAKARVRDAEVDTALTVSEGDRTAAQNARLWLEFLRNAPELADARKPLEALRVEPARGTATLVMRERPANNPRPTFVHKRGEFLQPTDRVEAVIPAALSEWPADRPKNRLEFAKWLASERNPLVGRVTMNRQWGAIFGKGLVRTSEDFGLQGELPSHPELLDWLAVEFMKRGWSMKAMHRLIVTSATYRQSSRVTPEALAKDPLNRLLGRAPRYRIDGELVRDVVLRASGLLSTKLGGPSVYPPQPPGVTSEGTYGALAWTVSTGEDRYRRGLYTFAKRTAPFAMFGTFDAPSGEACVPRREVSNTPLQALTLLNDATSMEAARALGNLANDLPTVVSPDRSGTPVAKTSGPDIRARIVLLFRRCLTRPPTPEELAELERYFAATRASLVAASTTAVSGTTEETVKPGEILGLKEGETQPNAADLATWTLVARALLNLDETITRE
jgi:hypothetical protein